MPLTTDILLLFIEGDLDCTSVPSLYRHVCEAIDRGCRRVILNLSATRYVDSVGVAFVFSVARRLRSIDGLLSLYGVRDEVHYVFRLARLVDFIPISLLGRRRHVCALEPHVHPLSCRTLAVKPGCLAETRERIRLLLNETTLSHDAVFDMTLAAGEALSNAIDHADAEGVVLTLSRFDDRVVIEVVDCGGGIPTPVLDKVRTFKDDAFRDDAMDCVLDAGAERGRGFKLMHLLVDKVVVCPRANGLGTLVKLTRLFD